ncbi:hypothetical protein TeGR_g2961, partial [Tetraparma gracilis]
VLDGIQKESSRAFAQDLRFRDYFGISGVFVAVALTAQICLAVILGFRAEAVGISAVQVVCLHGIAVFAASKLFNSAVYWRSLVEGLFDVQEGNVDPLEAWNKIPAAKRLKKWHNANFAIETGGNYSLLLIIGPEVFELMVQAANANFMAGYLDWPALSFYGTLISTNCILFGVCMLSDERFVSPSVIITVDVIMDASYIMFNIFYISNPASYWAIIIPLALSVNALSKGFKRHGLESVNHALIKQNVRKKNDESKANGTFEHDAIVELAERFNAGAENNRKEIRPPSGFDEFAPRLFTEDSGDVAADTLLMECVLPGVTPGQAFTFDCRYTPEEKGTGTEKVLQVMSDSYEVSHAKQLGSSVARLVSKRDFVGDTVWKKLKLEGVSDMFLSPKLYFKGGLLADSTCGFGVDLNPNEDGWELDVSECELEELGRWREAFADLEVLDLRDNELAKLPGWLGEGRMENLRELRASNNKLRNFTFVSWRESVGGVNSTALEVVDLRNNEIAELPYDVMDVEGEELRLLFDGNPCAEEVDWSGLEKDRLPVRMGVGYDNGGFASSLRVLKLGRNELDKSMFEELVAANFTRIEELDVSWNALGRIGEEVRGQKKLRRLDVSGNSGIGARDLVAAPPDLEMLYASFCGVDDITGEQAVELQDRNMVLHGNPVTWITWTYQNQLTKIPAWLRMLEKVTYADLGYCDVKEIKGGAFPASLEELNIQNQLAGLRLHPDSFEGLSKLWSLDISTNKLTEDDMHPGLFGDTKLEYLYFLGNPGMLNFDAAALFPGSSGQQLLWLGLENCGLTGIGGDASIWDKTLASR